MNAIRFEYDIFVRIFRANKGKLFSYIVSLFRTELFKLGCPDDHADYVVSYIAKNVNLQCL